MSLKASGHVKMPGKDSETGEVVIYSVPHSGTHFARRFVEALGKTTEQFHSDVPTGLGRLYQNKGKKAVIPFRHPYAVFESHWQRNTYYRPLGPRAVMELVVHHYASMMQTMDLLDFVALQVDCSPEQRIPQLKRVATHLGVEGTGAIMEWALEWPVIGWAKHETELPQDVPWQRLDDICRWAGYEPSASQPHAEGAPEHEITPTPHSGINLKAPAVQARGTAVIRRKDGSVVTLELRK